MGGGDGAGGIGELGGVDACGAPITAKLSVVLVAGDPTGSLNVRTRLASAPQPPRAIAYRFCTRWSSDPIAPRSGLGLRSIPARGTATFRLHPWGSAICYWWRVRQFRSAPTEGPVLEPFAAAPPRRRRRGRGAPGVRPVAPRTAGGSALGSWPRRVGRARAGLPSRPRRRASHSVELGPGRGDRGRARGWACSAGSFLGAVPPLAGGIRGCPMVVIA